MKCPTCKIEIGTVLFEQEVWHKCLKCGFKMPANHLNVNDMYAYLALDDANGNEGVVEVQSPIGPTPLVGADMD